MRSKLIDLQKSVGCSNYDIIILAESWLNSDISDAEINLASFQIFRMDRNTITSNKLRGGGIFIAIKGTIQAKLIKLYVNSIEQLFILCKYNNFEFIIGGVYIPPNSSNEVYQMHCHTVEDIFSSFPSLDVFIFGDYNLPEASWLNDNLGVNVICPQASSAVLVAQSFGFLHMYQVNLVPNNRDVLLDLLFTNNKNTVASKADDPLFPDSVHHIGYCFSIDTINSNYSHSLKFNVPYYDFRNADYIGLNNYLASIDWVSKLCPDDVDRATLEFYEILYTGIALYVPLRHFKSSSFPKYFNHELRLLIAEKKVAHKQYKKSNNELDYLKFSQLRHRCNEMSNLCYTNYINNINLSLTSDPKLFWKYLNDKRSSYSLPDKMFYDDEEAFNGKEIVGLFANYFATVYSDNQPINQATSVECNHLIITCPSLSIHNIFEKLTKIPNKLTVGPDGIPNVLLKSCICTLTNPLCFLFNSSLKQGVFPKIWKDSYVMPIFKSGDKGNVKNYRGVCIQSAIPKLFDSLMYDELSWSCKEVLINEQHGFCYRKSTVTNLLIYQNKLLNAIENKFQIDSIYTDFSKAFDRVNHRILINKLSELGFSERLLIWFNSFLTGRVQRVKQGNFISNEINVSSGVPQGSHCAPLLFCLFINDISNAIVSCEFLLFADDLKLFKTIKCINDEVLVQNDLNNLNEWCNKNCLYLNIDKCCFISFFKGNMKFNTSYCLGNSDLKRVSSVKDLGVTFNSQLNFNEHINNISVKSSKMLGFLLRNCREFSVESIKCVYCSLVRSHLEYASMVWSPMYAIHKTTIERIQNKFLRFCAFRINHTIVDHNYNGILCRLNLMSLESRRLQTDLIFVFKLLNGMISCPELLELIGFNVPRHLLRNNALFNVEFHSTNYGMHSPITRTLRYINESRLNVLDCSLSIFIKRIHQSL